MQNMAVISTVSWIAWSSAPALRARSTSLLVTSRPSLAALEGAEPLELDLMAKREALELLRKLAGRRRVRAEPAAAERIVELCGRLPLAVRIAVAAGVMVPLGILLGMPLPGGIRLLNERRPELVPWGWGLNGAFSVIGATLAIFIAMNWGFSATLSLAGLMYAGAATIVSSR